MMNWWSNKPYYKRCNWFGLSFAVLLFSSTLVESFPLVSLVGALPALGLLYAEFRLHKR